MKKGEKGLNDRVIKAKIKSVLAPKLTLKRLFHWRNNGRTPLSIRRKKEYCDGIERTWLANKTTDDEKERRVALSYGKMSTYVAF